MKRRNELRLDTARKVLRLQLCRKHLLGNACRAVNSFELPHPNSVGEGAAASLCQGRRGVLAAIRAAADERPTKEGAIGGIWVGAGELIR